jgi:glycosyltransferase involved in cell wall biosynthesis
VLRVLHVGKFYPPVTGGIERVVQSVCHATRGRIDNRVLAFHTGTATVDETVDGIPVTRVATHGAAGSVPISPAFFGQLRRADADVMILHEPNPWALLAYAAVRPRAPLAIWFHSEVVRPALTYALFYNPVARPAYRAARRFIVASPAVAEHAAALQPYRNRVSVIPYGIDVDGWRPTPTIQRRAAALRTEAGRPIVLFAGRHVPYKGVDVLIRAVASLPLDVVLLGDGRMRREWEALAAAQAGPAKYTFRGEVDDEEMRAWLAASRVMVLPSVTRAEAFGFVQLEAMACGTPVISTTVKSGVPWVNESGLVVAPGDVLALREAIARITMDDALAARVGAAGEARARSEFSMSRMAERFVEACTAVAANA